MCILFQFNIDVQNYSKCLGSLKIRKKKTKTLYEISKCAINMCVVVLPLGVKFLAWQVWLLVIHERYDVVLFTLCCLILQ